MKHNCILLSGASGFIGSHLIEELLNNNYQVVALIRNSSNLWRLNNLNSSNLYFIDFSCKNFKEKILSYKPTTFIHAAWQGLNSNERNDWNSQIKNTLLTLELLKLSSEVKIKKVISLGSQAEYGNFEGRINESAFCKPNTAYGTAKYITQIAVKSFCEINNIDWIWLRVFSLFGERDNESWIIPTIIKNILSNKPTDLTACEQKYDFMYVKTFAKAVIKIIQNSSGSEIYNLSSNTSIILKDLLESIKIRINPNAILNYSAIPYRKNQIMHMEGDCTKFINAFNIPLNPDYNKLIEVINYYKLNFNPKNESN